MVKRIKMVTSVNWLVYSRITIANQMSLNVVE